MSVERGVGVFDVGSHTAHIDIDLLHEEEIVCQLLNRLKGEANHYPGSHLVTRFPQRFQCFHPLEVGVETIIGVEFSV